MKLESIVCNKCGVPLEVQEGTNFTSCRHCGAQLAVRHTESASFTEVISDLKNRVDKLSRHNEIDMLDREWDAEKEQFMVTDKHGQRFLPSQSASLIGGFFVTVFGIIWTAFTAGMSGLVSFFPLFGILFILLGIASSIFSYNKARDYAKAYRLYKHRRAELLRKNSS